MTGSRKRSLLARAACVAAAVVLFAPAGALAAARDDGGGSGKGRGSDHASEMERNVPSSGKSKNGNGNGNGSSRQGGRDDGKQKVQGVVQLVTPSVVVCRQLDGTSVSVPYDRRTRFLVDGRPGKSVDVEAGDVVSASWQGGKTPATVRVEHG